MTIRRLGIAGAAALAIFALGACQPSSNASTPSPTPSLGPVVVSPYVPEPEYTPEPEPKQSKREQYIDLINENSSLWVYGDDLEDTFVDLGKTICETLDAGNSLELVAMAALRSGMDMEDAGVVTGAAILVYCPEYTDDMEEYVDEYA